MFARICKVIGTKDYINLKLTGKILTDFSYASGSGVYDLARWCYCPDLVRASGVPEEVFPEIQNKNLLGEVIAKGGLKQLRCAETEKYAHVTFFFNGQVEEPDKNEDRVLIPSPKVQTYDLKPDAPEKAVGTSQVADAVIGKLK
jgi:hypothetical protein